MAVPGNHAGLRNADASFGSKAATHGVAWAKALVNEFNPKMVNGR
jgi:hypothetical protein